ncbi:MAG: DUF4270 family protein [Hymenobacteraceae bacterium]|nr:DUF4270 family protein [Hymenobacteraceae bacterium]
MPFCTKRPRRNLGAALTSVALSFFVVACEPASEVGLDVLPDDVPSTATYVELPGRAATVLRNDSVLTANKNNALVGTLRDGLVGTTTAESYWQVSPLTTNPATTLPAGTTADSLVLTFGFSQFYGTADGRQRLEAYELTRGFANDTAYYASSPGLSTTPASKLGETTFMLRYAYVKADSVLKTPWIVGSTTKRADSTRVLQPVRIRVTTDLPQRLLAVIGKPELASLTALQPILKGVLLRPVVGSTGAIVNLTPQAAETQMVLYYRLPTDSVKQAPHTFAFSLGDPLKERYFTKIATTYADGEQLRAFATPAPKAAQDTVSAEGPNGFTAYLQGGVELGTRIDLGDFAALRAKKGRIVINRAELFIPVKPYAAGVYPVPSQAYLVEVDARNQLLKTAGQFRTVQSNGNDPTSTTSPAVVTYDASQRAYRILLTTYLDARLNDKLADQLADAFWLLPTIPGVSSLSLNRALIDAAPGQIKLKVYYSELN